MVFFKECAKLGFVFFTGSLFFKVIFELFLPLNWIRIFLGWVKWKYLLRLILLYDIHQADELWIANREIRSECLQNKIVKTYFMYSDCFSWFLCSFHYITRWLKIRYQTSNFRQTFLSLSQIEKRRGQAVSSVFKLWLH